MSFITIKSLELQGNIRTNEECSTVYLKLTTAWMFAMPGKCVQVSKASLRTFRRVLKIIPGINDYKSVATRRSA